MSEPFRITAKTAIRLLTAVVLVLCAIPAASPAAELAPEWEAASAPAIARSAATLTQLVDGRFLVAGGWQGYQALSSVEIYDAQSGVWRSAPPMSTPRGDHAAALLADGRVLVAGGSDGEQVLASSEIFDPVTGSWTPGPSFRWKRRGHALTTLENGRVLATGGLDAMECTSIGLSHTEVLDAQQLTWRDHAPLFRGRAWHSATLLPGDRILLVGDGGDREGPRGEFGHAEVFDASTGTSSATPISSQIPTSFDVTGHSATRLPDGRVLLVGGCCVYVPGEIAMTGPDELGASPAVIYDPSTGAWLPTSPMGAPRAWHTAAALADGRVLVAGGVAIRPGTHHVGMRDDLRIADAEIFDPSTNSWGHAGRLREPRLDHVAVPLPTGGVLIAGGIGDHASRPLSSAEQFSPPDAAVPVAPAAHGPAQPIPHQPSLPTVTSLPRHEWQIKERLPSARFGVAAALLPDGNVLVAGGSVQDGHAFIPTNGVDVYDPVRDRWLTAPSMKEVRGSPTATTLPDGRILVSSSGTPEIFSPSTYSWAVTSPPPVALSGPVAVLLSDGRVLLTGGASPGSACQPTRAAQIYDPTENTWKVVARMTYPRSGHSATLLADGRALVAGGRYNNTAEIYDPRTDAWTATRMMSAPHTSHTAHLLPDGRVLVVGGCCPLIPRIPTWIYQPFQEPSESPAEVYDPSANTWTPTAPMRYPRHGHASAVLPDGSVVVAGGLANRGIPEPESVVSYFSDIRHTEVYDIRSQAWLPAAPLPGARFDHAMVALPDDRVLSVGGAEVFEERGERRPVPYVDLFTPRR